jgi:hypothetical protein
MLLDLAQRVAWQFIDNLKAARNFEGGQVLTADGVQSACVNRSITQDQKGYRDLASHGVSLGSDGGFGNARLFHQELLDLAWVNVEAAGDDEIAASAAERVIAFG